jgi:hypothetical protein
LAVGSFFFSGFLALAYDAQAIRLLADLLLGFFAQRCPIRRGGTVVLLP